MNSLEKVLFFWNRKTKGGRCRKDTCRHDRQHSGKLHREHTIANGDGVCDYWIVGDQVNNPS